MKIVAVISVVVLIGVAVTVGLLIDTDQKAGGDRVVEESLERLLGTGSFTIESKIEILSDKGNIIFGINGALDKASVDNVQTEGQVSLSIEAEGAKQELALEFKAKDKTFYVKLINIPEIASAMLDEPLIASLKDKWIEFDFETIKQLTGQSFEDSDINSDQTKAFLGDVQELFKGQAVFAIDDNLGDETISGDKTVHYKVSVDKEALKELIPAYINLAKKYASEEQQALYEENIDQILQDIPTAIDDAWVKIGGIEFDVWVVKGSGYLKKIQYTRSIKDMLLDESETIDLDIAFSVEFSDFNEVPEVIIPTDTLTIEELLMSQFNLQDPELQLVE